MIKKLLILMSTVACLLLFVFVLNNTSATVVNITDQTMQRDTLKVALHDKVYKMSYKQNHDDALTGLEVDLAKTLAKNIYGDAKLIDIREVSNKTALHALKKKFVDCVIATQPMVEDSGNLYSTSYYTDYVDIIFKNGNIGDIKDLENKKVGVISKSYAYTTLEAKTTKAKMEEVVTYVDYENYDEAFKDLEAGKIDAFCDNRVFISGANYNRYTLEECKYYIVLRGDDVNLQKKINETLSSMESSGELIALINKWK